MTDTLTLKITSPVSCLCDFTYNFYWQHKGSELEPNTPIPDQSGSDHTYQDLVKHLISGGDVHITGNPGSRLASSLGVDLKYFGGSGKAIETGSIIIDGDTGTRMGISMVSGRIYVSGAVSEPMGNVVEVVSDMKGYRCFKSITDILHNGMEDDEFYNAENIINEGEIPYLRLADGVLRDTIGARNNRNANIEIEGDVALSTGILMRNGIISIEGNAGMNTGTLLSGGTVMVKGNVGEFAAANMRAGNLILTGKTLGYMCANMHGGAVFIKSDVKVIPPIKKCQATSNDLKMLMDILETNRLDAMMYRKYAIC